ncbi:MAG: hypothetical protein ACNA8W_14420, partial [Bradymonadaceae bacterium]
MKNRIRLAVLMTVTLMMGCGFDGPDRTDGQETSGWSVGEKPGGEFGGSQVAPEIEIPNGESQPAALQACVPRALSYQSPEVPELPPEVLEACPLEAVAWTLRNDQTPHRVVSYERDGDRVVRIEDHAGRGEAQRTSFGLNEGRIVVVEDTMNFLYYGQGKQIRRWEFDEEGRLESYRERMFNGEQLAEHLEVFQSWENGRLVQRRERSRRYDQDSELTYRWGYDGSRLIAATITDADDELLHHVEYTYTESGRAASVHRRVQGVDVLVQTWEWSDDGELLGREVLLDVGAVLSDREIEGAMNYTHGIDDFAPRNDHQRYGYSAYHAYSANPWPDAHFREHSREQERCLMPPTALGHGFPDEEPEYHLGWAQGERPMGMGFAYGYGGYGWGYGDEGWFGHEGVGSMSWPGVMIRHDHALLFSIQYDARGRMVREEIDMITPHAETLIERTRTFDDDEMREDRVVVHNPSHDVTTRVLVFEHDELGQIAERRLYHEDIELSRHEWLRDGLGNIILHDIHERLQYYTYSNDLFPDVQTPDATLELLSSFERAFDTRGNLVKEKSTHGPQTYMNGTYARHAYDEDDRVVETLHFGARDDEPTSREVFEYDAQGRLI